jgi:subtilisin family serine protease
MFDGTSAATPIVSGAVALILEANPNLKSRDVRRILGLTAAKNDRTDINWIRNGASTYTKKVFCNASLTCLKQTTG